MAVVTTSRIGKSGAKNRADLRAVPTTTDGAAAEVATVATDNLEARLQRLRREKLSLLKNAEQDDVDAHAEAKNIQQEINQLVLSIENSNQKASQTATFSAKVRTIRNRLLEAVKAADNAQTSKILQCLASNPTIQNKTPVFQWVFPFNLIFGSSVANGWG